VVALAAEPATLNPALDGSPETVAVGCQIWNGLVVLDRHFEPRPELARGWTWSADGRRLTLNLQPGVRWHDGPPLTAADVKFTLEAVVARHNTRAAAAFARVEGVDAADPATVVLRLSQPYGPLLQFLTCADAPVLPRHVYADGPVGSHPRNTVQPVGTGPFRWAGRGSGRIELGRNPSYFRPGQPYLDRLEFRVIPEAAARLRALAAREVDYVPGAALPPAALARLRADPGVVLREGAGLPRSALLLFNTRRAPVADMRVRRALAMGLSRTRIADEAWAGLGVVSRGAVHAGLHWARNAALDYTRRFAFDPARGRALLTEAGYPAKDEGPRLTLRLMHPANAPGLAAAASLAQESWRSVDVAVTVTAGDAGGEWDLRLALSPPGGDPDLATAPVYLSVGPQGPNATGYANPTVDDLFAQGAALRSRPERRKYYTHAQSIIAEDLPVLPLVDLAEPDAVSEALRGLTAGGTPWAGWDRVWRADGAGPR
jgi:peptide/nickel transport system substrate-binding protein